MRRSLAAALVAALAAALVVGGISPASASAGAPPPGVVKDIPGIPSNTVRMTQTSSGSWMAADWWKYVGWKIQQPGTDVATIPSTGKTVAVAPKPITPASALTRASGVGAGTAVVGFNLGWALGQGGLVAYTAATGQSYEGMICSTPDWYQGANDFLMMGVKPDCKGTVSTVTPGSSLKGGVLAFNGWTMTYKGNISKNWGGATGTVTTYCFKMSGNIPGGYQLVIRNSSAVGPAFAQGWTCSSAPLNVADPSTARSIQGAPGVIPRYDLRDNQTQVYVATMQQPEIVENSAQTRTPDCTIGWKDGTTTSGVGTPYKETEGVPLSAPGLGCKSAWDAKPGAGRTVMPDRIGVSETDEAGAKTEISGQSIPSFSPTEKIDLDPTLGNGRGLVLEKVVNGTTQSCMTWEVDCAQWWEATSNGTTEGPYRCTYGGAPLSIGECGPYRKTFDTKTNSPTITDPTTGAEVGWGTTPQTGNSIDPGTGPGTGADPTGECFAQGWAAFNPIEWVLTPVKCAMVWAFVPRPAKVAEVTTSIDAKWKATTPGKLAATFTGLGAAFASLGEGGCAGVPVALPIPDASGHVTTKADRYLAACPGDFFAPWAPIFKSLISVAIVFVAVWGVRDQLDKFVNN